MTHKAHLRPCPSAPAQAAVVPPGGPLCIMPWDSLPSPPKPACWGFTHPARVLLHEARLGTSLTSYQGSPTLEHSGTTQPMLTLIPTALPRCPLHGGPPGPCQFQIQLSYMEYLRTWLMPTSTPAIPTGCSLEQSASGPPGSHNFSSNHPTGAFLVWSAQGPPAWAHYSSTSQLVSAGPLKINLTQSLKKKCNILF